MEKEFDRDYAGEIALEHAKLDKTLFLALEEYDNTAVLVGGKKWYSVGLENNDNAKEKNEVEKRNVLLRLIDKVIEFIKMIGKKIVEWYRACRDAIVKFFTKDNIDPAAVAARFDLLVENFSDADATKLIARMSKENKAFLAEILSSDYSKAFTELYSYFAKTGEKANNVSQFVSGNSFFKEFIQKSDELKNIAQKSGIYDNVDETLKKLLASGGKEAIKSVTTNFNAVGTIHKTNIDRLEKLLKQIPNDALDGIDGDDLATKRREVVKLISDIIRINSEIVLKVNNHMQASVMLMTLVVKTRTHKVAYLPM